LWGYETRWGRFCETAPVYNFVRYPCPGAPGSSCSADFRTHTRLWTKEAAAAERKERKMVNWKKKS
jgi:hypothetical protein